MKYRKLLEQLKDLELMDPSALDNDVSIYDASEDEYHSGADDMITFEIAGHENDVLDDGHPFLKMRK
jgi:hypothetical protein